MKTSAPLLALLMPHLANGFMPFHHQPTTTPTAIPAKSAADDLLSNVQQTGLAVAFSLAMLVAPMNPAFAADFAGKDISGQDFSGQDLAGKDFTSVVAKATRFGGANLEGASFRKANLLQADFTGANLQNSKFEDAVLDGSIFKDVTAQKATFSASILDIKDLENADLTDSLWPSKYCACIQLSVAYYTVVTVVLGLVCLLLVCLF